MADDAEIDGFNSSDIEVEERPSRYARVGMDSLTRALAQATEDRISSKVAYKQRPMYYGSPKTQMCQALWHNRFRSFLSTTLNVASDVIPTCEHIIRFMYSYPKYVMSRAPSGVVSHETLSGGISWIIQTTQCTYPDFKLKSGEVLRIKAVLTDLLEKGMITKDASRAVRWMGSRLVYLICGAWIRHASENGCRNWDFVLQGALSISLMASTGARTGDIARTRGWTGREYAKYGDFTVQLVTDEAGIETLDCLVELRYTKGSKDNNNVQHTTALKVLSDSFNSCDPIKLLLIMALRTGNVEQTSIAALLETTRRRRNKTVVWKDPSLPILKAARCNHSLIIDSPAPEHQSRTILQRAACLVGVLSLPGGHDIRRGVAFETYNLSSNIDTGSEERARKLLGHSSKTQFNGITSKYIGGARSSHLEERIQTDLTRSKMVNGHECAPQQYKAPVFTSHEVTEYLVANNLPTTGKVGRRKARRHMSKAHYEAWAKVNNRSEIDALDSNYENNTNVPIAPPITTAATSTKRKRLAMSGSDEDSVNTSSVVKGKRKHSAEEEEGEEENEMLIDPRLLDFVSCVNSGTPLEMDMQDEELFDLEPVNRATAYSHAHDHTTDAPNSTPSNVAPQDPQTLPCLQFIDYFSRINLQAENVVPSNGGSKDASTKFEHNCTKGCGYSNVSLTVLRYHEISCKGKSRCAKLVNGHLLCPRGCGKRYSLQRSLQNHVLSVHDYIPGPCQYKECDQTIIIQNYCSRAKHMREVHSSFRARTCPYCLQGSADAAKIWKTKEAYKSHVIRMHQLTRMEFESLVKEQDAAYEAEK